jgi:hypothetical protein
MSGGCTTSLDEDACALLSDSDNPLEGSANISSVTDDGKEDVLVFWP